MFTFTLTAATVEELHDLILDAAAKIAGPTVTEEKTLEDFSLQEIAEHLETQGYKIHEDR